jgi:DNA-binding NarL/FixJ family response regulator
MLCRSVHTINTHRKNILNKLGLNNPSELVLYAVKRGLVAA